MKHVYAVVDTETTGLKISDRVCEIALIIMDSKMSVLDMFHTFVFSGVPNSAGRINQISETELASAPTVREVESHIASMLFKHKVTTAVGHNISFDLRMLSQSGFHSFGLFTNQSMCTMLTERADAALSSNLSLFQVAARYGVVHRHLTHSAFADAAVCASVFRWQYLIRIPPIHWPVFILPRESSVLKTVKRPGVNELQILESLQLKMKEKNDRE
jgi:DNA polymerase-3 subunit epsilon